VIGAGMNLHRGSGISLTVASLPGAEVRPLRIPSLRSSGPLQLPANLASEFGDHWLLLSDARTMDTEALIERLDAEFPGGSKLGAVVSDPQHPGRTSLFLDGEVFGEGAVALSLGGALDLECLVAPGVKPIGDPLCVTEIHENVIVAFDRGPACDVLADMMRSLSAAEHEQASRGLCMGLQIGECESDYVVRGLLGISRTPPGIALAAVPSLYGVVCFHVPDPEQGRSALRRLLRAYRARQRGELGGLCFRSHGKTEEFFASRDLGDDLIREELGEIELGGCFCNGEIGPLGRRTSLHGYATSLGLLRARRAP